MVVGIDRAPTWPTISLSSRPSRIHSIISLLLDLDEFKTILKPRLKLIVQNDEQEWFIVFVSKAHPNNDQATKLANKVYAKLEVDFSSKKRERCCKFDLYSAEETFWEDLESKIMECIRNTLDKPHEFSI
ncbi:trafficking protein particle complex II-specific subunit 130 homolog [Rosa chinensis]|uniref:trafficking protein particle complex II-specific subunit 130 homolog n=1 Tax=Rosa chinensis TaxID=74649 RepID=UPI000D08BF29|nr:trafficking protein particle complex II-specific subunit 130 homolog [Rosa chinensis]